MPVFNEGPFPNGLKANPDKFHLLLSDTEENYCINVDGFNIPNSPSQKPLGVTIDNKMSFKFHLTNICADASQKLHGLSRVGNYMTLKQRKIILGSFIVSQFGYCPLVWMFHSREINNRINKIHERSLRIAYQDHKSSFEALLKKDESYYS